MNRPDFKIWLEKEKERPLGKRSCGSYASRCERVENGLNIDLDEIYDQGKEKEVLTILEYIKNEKKGNLPEGCGIAFDPDACIHGGISSIKTSVNSYFNYRAARAERLM